MMAALEMCRNERDIRAIVVIGSGKAFWKPYGEPDTD